jgi:hypothetical protein
MLSVMRGDGNHGLAAVRDFASGIARGAWFAACGEDLAEAERVDAAAYLAALGMPDTTIAGVAGWSEAAAVTQRQDWNRAWWEAETKEQQDLHRRAEKRFGSHALLSALSIVTQAATELHGAAAIAASRAGLADAALTRVAAGAAAQACHHAALALSLDAGPDHLFARKYRLFVAGRWPLGIVGDRFFVF